MMGSWFNLAMLGLESQRVIWLRTMKLAAGGPAAITEANLMVAEKMFAGAAAASQIALGASGDKIVKSYRKKVRANTRRLAR